MVDICWYNDIPSKNGHLWLIYVDIPIYLVKMAIYCWYMLIYLVKICKNGDFPQTTTMKLTNNDGKSQSLMVRSTINMDNQLTQL